MSIEALIQENTAAIRELTAAFKTLGISAAGATQVIDDTAKEMKALAKEATEKKDPPKKKVEEVKKPVAETASSDPGATPPSEAPKDAAPEISYKDVQKIVLEMSIDKREETVSLLQRYGCAKATGLKPEQYADFIADAKKIMAGELDPEDSLA